MPIVDKNRHKLIWFLKDNYFKGVNAQFLKDLLDKSDTIILTRDKRMLKNGFD